MMGEWLGVEPRHLEALAAVSRAGTFRAAATSLRLAQSALSERIAQLERLVGACLVERSPGHAGVALTDVGARLAGHGEDILAALDAALADVRVATLGAAGSLRVGVYDTVATSLVPCAIARLIAERPAVRISVRQDRDWRRLCPLVASGELDVGLGELPLPPGPYTLRTIVSDPWALVVRADSPLARRGVPPTPAELAALALVAPAEPLRDAIEAHLALAGAHARFVSDPQGDAAVRELVARGVGAAVMPRLAVGADDPRLATIDLRDVMPPRDVVAYWHRDREQVSMIERFVSALERASAPGVATVG
jgi:DNA-binding transcriptional LysR family regulator